MKIASLALASSVALIGSSALAQQPPNDTCMDVTWFESQNPNFRSGWMYNYNEEKYRSKACESFRERAAEEYLRMHPPFSNDPAYQAAIEAHKKVVSTHNETIRTHQFSADQSSRLTEEYRQLRMLYDDGLFATYRPKLGAYQNALQDYPVSVERYKEAQAEAVATYDQFRDQFRTNFYPASYDWSRGGNQGQ